MSDLINRQSAINEIERAKVRIYHSIERAIGRSIIEILDEVEKDVRGLPPAEPKRGKWIDGYCSECGAHAPFWAMASTYHKSNFCPNCGADMRGEQK